MVWWRELDEVENECISHNLSLCHFSVQNYQNWWKFDKVLTKTILHSFWDTVYFELILKLFQYFIPHVATSGTETKLFQPLRDLWNYFKIISATMNIQELKFILWNNFEMISGKFPRAEIKLFQTDVDEGWK